MADGQGGVWALGVRDCSYQRRHQKVVEESASPALTRRAGARARRGRGAARARRPATAAPAPSSSSTSPTSGASRSWRSTPACRSSTRSPRWSPAPTSCALQLHVAAGGRLEGDPPPPRGHAIEVRLNAEDPGRGFAPAPGRITLLRLPDRPRHPRRQRRRRGRHACRREFDSMIAKIIAHGDTREQAIARLRRAVADTMVAIDEGTTNQGFLLELLGRPELRAGEVDTGWLDRLQAQGDVRAGAPRRRRARAGRDRALRRRHRRRARRASTRSPAAAARRPRPRSATRVDLLHRGVELPLRASARPRPARYLRRGRRRAHRGRRRAS